MGLADWDVLVGKYFEKHEYEVFVPERGWGESIVKRAAVSEFRAARWLGGTLAAICKKSGAGGPALNLENFETFLRCPDCHAALGRDTTRLDTTGGASHGLRCASCGYHAPEERQ